MDRTQWRKARVKKNISEDDHPSESIVNVVVSDCACSYLFIFFWRVSHRCRTHKLDQTKVLSGVLLQ
jgi:hypothetical protein